MVNRQIQICYNGALFCLLQWSLPLAASSLTSTYEQIETLAAKMAKIATEKSEHHLTIIDFYQHLYGDEPITPEVSAETSHEATQDTPLLTATAPQTLQADDQFLQDWYSLNNQYQHIYDEYIIHKHAYIIETVNALMEERYYAMPKDKQREHRNIFGKMQEEFHLWQDHKQMVGDFALAEATRLKGEGKECSFQQLQQKRKYAYDKYFYLARDFQHEAGGKAIKKAVLAPVRIGKIAGLALASPLILLGYWTGRLFNESPLYTLSMYLTRKMGKGSEQFKELGLVGREHLRQLKTTPKNTINLIFPNHRNDVGDMYMLASLKISPAMMFLNAQIVAGVVDHWVSNPLGYVLASIPELVSVGHSKGIGGLSPTEKMLETLRKGKIPNVINYPQGFVANLHEVLGISPSVMPKLVGPLLDAGYNVRVFPVSYEIESSFLWDKELSRGFAPMVRVSRPLTAPMVSAIHHLQTKVNSTMPRLFETFMRANWLESITTYPELSISEIQERIRLALDLGESFSLLPKKSL